MNNLFVPYAIRHLKAVVGIRIGIYLPTFSVRTLYVVQGISSTIGDVFPDIHKADIINNMNMNCFIIVKSLGVYL